jgi:parvulin-like peptidyl-prolyl isomerase
MSTGAISRPVKSKLGFHVVRIADRRPRPFNAVREEIDSLLRTPQDPYRSFLENAYEDVEVASRFGRLDLNFRVVDRA